MLTTPNKSAVVARLDELHIVYSNTQGLSDAEWDTYIELCVQLFQQRGAPKAVLVFTPRGGPNAKQRKRLSDATVRVGFDQLRRTALVTSSPIVRGLLTAIAWLFPRQTLRCFGIGELDRALAFLADEARFDRTEACALIERMMIAFGDDPTRLARLANRSDEDRQ